MTEFEQQICPTPFIGRRGAGRGIRHAELSILEDFLSIRINMGAFQAVY